MNLDRLNALEKRIEKVIEKRDERDVNKEIVNRLNNNIKCCECKSTIKDMIYTDIINQEIVCINCSNEMKG